MAVVGCNLLQNQTPHGGGERGAVGADAPYGAVVYWAVVAPLRPSTHALRSSMNARAMGPLGAPFGARGLRSQNFSRY